MNPHQKSSQAVSSLHSSRSRGEYVDVDAVLDGEAGEEVRASLSTVFSASDRFGSVGCGGSDDWSPTGSMRRFEENPMAALRAKRTSTADSAASAQLFRTAPPRVERLSVGDDDEDRARRNTAFAAMPLSQARKSDILGRAQRTSTSTSHAADRP